MKAHRIVTVLLLLAAVGQRFAAAADQWVEVSSPHFTLQTNAGEKQGRHILDQFERMRWVFQTLFPKANVDPAAPIFVLAAKDEKTFKSMEPAAYLAKGQMKLAGYFLHSVERNYILLGLDTDMDHPFATIYHEYTHVQFAYASDWMPLWLNEGTAEFFQNTTVNGKDVRLGQASPDDILYLRDHPLIPLNVLLSVDSSSPYYHEEQKGSVFYAESWALMHYLMVSDREKHLHRLSDYLDLVQNHEDPVAAGQKAFGDLRQMEKELNLYIQQVAYKEFVLNSAAAPIDESQYKVRPVSAVEAEARRADVLACVRRSDEARALLDTVLKTDPNNVQAHETMGLLAYLDGNREEARKWYGEAVKLGSQDFLAYFFFAQLSMGQRDAIESDEIESSLRTAIKLNPRFAPSYDLLAGHFAMKHENLDEAHRLNVQAVVLEPASVNFRVNAANVLMEMQRYDDALAVLKLAAKIAKKPGEAEMVESRIDQLQQFRVAGARGGVIVGEQQEAPSPGSSGVVDLVPAHPTMKTTGPMHSAEGVIRLVKCSPPHGIEFTLEVGPGHTLALYNNDFTSIDLTAAAEITVKGSMYPCTDFEGKKVQVRYVESTDNSIDGQVTAIELRK